MWCRYYLIFQNFSGIQKFLKILTWKQKKSSDIYHSANTRGHLAEEAKLKKHANRHFCVVVPVIPIQPETS